MKTRLTRKVKSRKTNEGAVLGRERGVTGNANGSRGRGREQGTRTGAGDADGSRERGWQPGTRTDVGCGCGCGCACACADGSRDADGSRERARMSGAGARARPGARPETPGAWPKKWAQVTSGTPGNEHRRTGTVVGLRSPNSRAHRLMKGKVSRTLRTRASSSPSAREPGKQLESLHIGGLHLRRPELFVRIKLPTSSGRTRLPWPVPIPEAKPRRHHTRSPPPLALALAHPPAPAGTRFPPLPHGPRPGRSALPTAPDQNRSI